MALQQTVGSVPPAVRSPGELAPLTIKRISWGAVLAGVITTLALQLVLSLLGVAIGASTIDPMQDGSPQASSLGTGAGLWWVGTALVSVFAGGWVAGRLAGVPVRTDGLLHGFVAWGLATLLLFYMLTTTVGSLVGGAFNVVGSVVSGAARGGAEVAQDRGGQPLGNIEGQIRQMLGSAGLNVDQATRQLGDAARDENVREVVRKIITAGPQGLSPADRESAITALTTHTGLSRPAAEQQIAEWERSYAQAAAQAREAGEATADAVTQGAIWTFIALTLGAVAAAVGGMLGTPRDLGIGRSTSVPVHH
ncbi:MAG: PhnA-like protein [Rhodospirillales bacterium]|nr:PhnA-like protein [Rhodospirillales bacterium]